MPIERLFFALWFDTSQSQAVFRHMQHATQAIQAKHLQARYLHLTLAFIGNTEQRVYLQVAAAKIQAHSFSLTLNTLGYWKQPQIVWLAPKQPPEGLLHLRQKLSDRLQHQCGYQPETRAYQPLVTLLRKVKNLPVLPAIDPTTWCVTDFCLARSVPTKGHSHYEVIQHFDLLR